VPPNREAPSWAAREHGGRAASWWAATAASRRRGDETHPLAAGRP
jgi:hypothetical protein